MTTDLRVLRLTSEEINGGAICGTGEQLALVLETLAPVLPAWQWYAADVDVNGALTPAAWATTAFAPVGATTILVERLHPLPQLIWGVFLALPPGAPTPTASAYGDDASHTNYAPGGVVVRAFDTSYVEVAAPTPAPLAALQARFGGHWVAE